MLQEILLIVGAGVAGGIPLAVLTFLICRGR